jgi:hypothetical protein
VGGSTAEQRKEAGEAAEEAEAAAVVAAPGEAVGEEAVEAKGQEAVTWT